MREDLSHYFRFDQHLVSDGFELEADAEQSFECGMACPPPVEAEGELIEIVLDMLASETVIDAQSPCFQV